MSDPIVLDKAARAALVDHVESLDGWPAGFGIWGTKIKHDAQEVLTLWEEDLGEAFSALKSLLASVPATAPAPAPDADPAVTVSTAPAGSDENPIDLGVIAVKPVA